MIFCNITYVALTNNMADTCVRLASRPGLCQTYIARTVLDCRLRCIWRGLRLLTTWQKSFVSYASAPVSMSKICNRYLAKIDIWYNSNLWWREAHIRPLQIVLDNFKKIATKPVRKFFKSVKNWKRYDRISKSCHILMLFLVNVCESKNIN